MYNFNRSVSIDPGIFIFITEPRRYYSRKKQQTKAHD